MDNGGATGDAEEAPLVPLEERLADLAAEDPVLARSLQSMLPPPPGAATDHAAYVESLGAVFERRMSSAAEVLGQEQVVELVPGGSQTAVTSENAEQFVGRYVEHKLCDSIAAAAAAFRAGLIDALRQPGLLQLFSPLELQALLGGQGEIDNDTVAVGSGDARGGRGGPDGPDGHNFLAGDYGYAAAGARDGARLRHRLPAPADRRARGASCLLWAFALLNLPCTAVYP